MLVTNRKTDLFVPTPYPRLAESRAAGAGVGGRVLKKNEGPWSLGAGELLSLLATGIRGIVVRRGVSLKGRLVLREERSLPHSAKGRVDVRRSILKHIQGAYAAALAGSLGESGLCQKICQSTSCCDYT